MSAQSSDASADPLTSTRSGPESFAEVEVLPSNGRACRYCPAQATHRLKLTATTIVSGGGRGPKANIADHTQGYCEKHAAGLFHKIRQAMK